MEGTDTESWTLHEIIKNGLNEVDKWRTSSGEEY